MSYISVQYVKRLLVAAAVTFVFLKTTTFGWLPDFGPQDRAFNDERGLAQIETGLRGSVYDLAATIGVRSSVPAKDRTVAYLVQKLQAMGYDVKIQTYKAGDSFFQNIIAGKDFDRSKEMLLVGAHYDTCFGPGADDNASGVAGVLELARLLREERFGLNVAFVFFANEEPPFFNTSNMGSRVFARDARKIGLRLKGAIVLESIGYYSNKPFSQRYLPLLGMFFPNVGNFIAVISDIPSRFLLERAVTALKQLSGLSVKRLAAPGQLPGISFSDQASFWREEYPAIMITDTAYLRNPNYHTERDLPETLDYRRMARLVWGLAGTIKVLAG